MFDPFEYLVLRHKDGLLQKEFKTPLGKVSYHVPCHLRVQNIGQKTREMLEMVPGTRSHTVERCSGHDGTWGVKKRVLRELDEDRPPGIPADGASEPDYVSSDCPIAARHIRRAWAIAAPRRARSIRSRCCASPTAFRRGDQPPKEPLPCRMKAITSRSSKLSPETMDFHRAVVSLIEELEAVDWYNQRVDACTDPELKGILAHNRDEEIEHASMTLEWIRRQESGVRPGASREAVQDRSDHRRALIPGHGDHPRQPAVARGLREGARRVPRARAWRTRRPDGHSRRPRDAHLRGRAHGALPDPGDAAHREVFEEAGIQDELDAYNPLVPDGDEFQGDDADRVRGRGRSAGAARAPRRHRAPGMGGGRGLPRVLCDRRRGPAARNRNQDRRCAFPALRARSRGWYRHCGAARASPSASITLGTKP